jgi:phage replication O-like protein O
MAKSPQLEDGFIKIASELALALARINLSAYESRIVWCIFQKTYGWNKKSDRISFSQFEEMTHLKRWHIARTLDLLVEKEIIIRHGEGYDLEYGIQKDYDLWKNIHQSHEKSLPNGVTEIITKRGNDLLPNGVTNVDEKSLSRSAPGTPHV